MYVCHEQRNKNPENGAQTRFATNSFCEYEKCKGNILSYLISAVFDSWCA